MGIDIVRYYDGSGGCRLRYEVGISIVGDCYVSPGCDYVNELKNLDMGPKFKVHLMLKIQDAIGDTIKCAVIDACVRKIREDGK